MFSNVEVPDLSGIAAIIRFDGGSVAPGEIGRMTAAMHYRGVDGIAHWSDGQGAALGHCMLRTTAESLEEVQPLANEDASLVLVMDGWLSNWEELRSDLLARGARLRTRSDAELVLRAYEAWGEDCPKHIDGEFAFLVWDKRRQVAFCARDLAGLRPFFYHWDGRRLLVASDMAVIVRHPGVEQVLNRGMMAEFMAAEWFNREETLWSGVMRLTPAHWMRFGRDGQSSSRYWMPPMEVSIFYKRDEDYFDHYRELLFDSVRRASRTHLPLGFHVSGGLDSSANFCVAHELLRTGRLPAPSIEGYTYFFAEGGEADEIEYARAVGQYLGRTVREVPPFMPELSWFEQRIDADLDIPSFPNGAMEQSIGKVAVADGCRIILNGEGGDEWMEGKPFFYQELLAARDWRQMGSAFREDLFDLGVWKTARRILRTIYLTTAPELVKSIRTKYYMPRGPNQHNGAFWLSDGMQELFFKRRDMYGNRELKNISNLSRRDMYFILTIPYMEHIRNFMSRQGARIGYETRSPMYVRRFIEFSFATPERLKIRGTRKKFMHSMALKGLVPDAVLDRRTKAGFSVAFERQLCKAVERLVVPTMDGGSGNVDRDGIARLFARFCQNPESGTGMWELWSIFVCERLVEMAASRLSGGE